MLNCSETDADGLPLLSVDEHLVPLLLLQQWMNETLMQMKRVEVIHKIAASHQCPFSNPSRHL